MKKDILQEVTSTLRTKGNNKTDLARIFLAFTRDLEVTEWDMIGTACKRVWLQLGAQERAKAGGAARGQILRACLYFDKEHQTTLKILKVPS